MLNHVGLLVNEPPGTAGLRFIKSSENVDQNRLKAYGDPAYYIILHRHGMAGRIPYDYAVFLPGGRLFSYSQIAAWSITWNTPSSARTSAFATLAALIRTMSPITRELGV